MKVNRLEAHDRLQHLHQDQGEVVAQGASDCLKKNSLSLALQERSPYVYIFAHVRTADDGVMKRLIWQPRLSKPKAQLNSYLFRAKSKTDIVEVIWMLPPRELHGQYNKGNITEHDIVNWSIYQYNNNREALEAPDAADLPDSVGDIIYDKIKAEFRADELREKLFMPATSAEFSNPYLPLILH